MTRLQSFATRVTSAMLAAWCEPGDGKSETAARAILEREVRAFVGDFCHMESGVRDAADYYLDAPVPQREPPKPCEPWCGDSWGSCLESGERRNTWMREPVAADAPCYCTPACRDAGRPLNPRGTGRTP